MVFLQCIHYTEANLSQLKEEGLKYPSSVTEYELCCYTFTAGIYTYNLAQHNIDMSKPHIKFNYYGDYYKCIYDCDPQEYSKDVGITQEYLIPTLNIPYQYLDVSGMSILNDMNMPNTHTFGSEVCNKLIIAE